MWVALADAVVVLHLVFLLFVALGGFLASRWPRIVPFHLAAIAIALVSVTIHFDCPLTGWEQSLRRRGGQRAYTNGFVGHYLAGRIYPHGYAWAAQALVVACIVVSYAYLLASRRRGAPAH